MKIKLRPTNPAIPVRFEGGRRVLSQQGEEVEDSIYWRRRLRHKEVEIVSEKELEIKPEETLSEETPPVHPKRKGKE